MIKQSKIWGETACLFQNENVEVHRFIADASTFCSRHRHAHKYNLFFVEEGELEVTIHNDNGISDVTVLHAGDQTVVAPGVDHRFYAICKTIALEIYWVGLNPSDIIRIDTGGRHE